MAFRISDDAFLHGTAIQAQTPAAFTVAQREALRGVGDRMMRDYADWFSPEHDPVPQAAWSDPTPAPTREAVRQLIAEPDPRWSETQHKTRLAGGGANDWVLTLAYGNARTPSDAALATYVASKHAAHVLDAQVLRPGLMEVAIRVGDGRAARAQAKLRAEMERFAEAAGTDAVTWGAIVEDADGGELTAGFELADGRTGRLTYNAAADRTVGAWSTTAGEVMWEQMEAPERVAVPADDAVSQMRPEDVARERQRFQSVPPAGPTPEDIARERRKQQQQQRQQPPPQLWMTADGEVIEELAGPGEVVAVSTASPRIAQQMTLGNVINGLMATAAQNDNLKSSLDKLVGKSIARNPRVLDSVDATIYPRVLASMIQTDADSSKDLIKLYKQYVAENRGVQPMSMDSPMPGADAPGAQPGAPVQPTAPAPADAAPEVGSPDKPEPPPPSGGGPTELGNLGDVPAEQGPTEMGAPPAAPDQGGKYVGPPTGNEPPSPTNLRRTQVPADGGTGTGAPAMPKSPVQPDQSVSQHQETRTVGPSAPGAPGTVGLPPEVQQYISNDPTLSQIQQGTPAYDAMVKDLMSRGVPGTGGKAASMKPDEGWGATPFDLVGRRARGTYVELDIVWDPNDKRLTDKSPGGLRHDVVTYVKALTTHKDLENLGDIGRPKLLVFDPDVGMATVLVRSSEGKQTVQLISDDESAAAPELPAVNVGAGVGLTEAEWGSA